VACRQFPGAPAVDPGIALPSGAGRDVLVRACLGCHDLGGLELFSGFYSRADWHELVLTMVAHGAELNVTESGFATDYLAEHFGSD
jgi:hypothetical protein